MFILLLLDVIDNVDVFIVAVATIVLVVADDDDDDEDAHKYI